MTELITSDQVKGYLGIDHAESDSRISSLIAFVDGWFKSETGRSFVTENRITRIDGGGKVLEVVNYPIQTVNSIKDTFEDDPEAIDSSDYDVDKSRGMIYQRSNGAYSRRNWPEGVLRWKVDYDGGYGTDREEIPQSVVLDLLEIIATLYNEPDLSIQSESIGDESVTRFPRAIQKDMRRIKLKHSGENIAI